MRSITRVSLVAMAVILALPAGATMIDLEFTGALVYVDTPLSGEFSVGDDVSIALSIDDSLTPTSGSNWSDYANALVSLEGIIGGDYSFSMNGNATAHLENSTTVGYGTGTWSNSWSGDRLAANTGSVVGDTVAGTNPFYWGQYAVDTSNTAFTSNPPLLSPSLDYSLFSEGFGFLSFDGGGGWILYELGSVNLEDTVVPEPATMTLLGLGLAGLAYRSRRKDHRRL